MQLKVMGFHAEGKREEKKKEKKPKTSIGTLSGWGAYEGKERKMVAKMAS